MESAERCPNDKCIGVWLRPGKERVPAMLTPYYEFDDDDYPSFLMCRACGYERKI